MVDPGSGPFLFDTSAESWLARTTGTWMREYMSRHQVHISAMAIVAGEIVALIPEPPTSPRRSHHLALSRADRLSRWRFDCMIAATALVARMPLIHNNAADFETIRGAIEKAPSRFPSLTPWN
jgi:hypothetical protein